MTTKAKEKGQKMATKVIFLAVRPHYWGKGNQIEEAKKNCQLESGYPRRKFRGTVYRITDRNAFVDDFGFITYARGSVCEKVETCK